MVRKTLKTVAITGFLSLLSVVTVFADPTPTNDTTKKIKLSTSAVDNIDDPSDLYFAWYYNKPQTDGTFLKVQLSENTDTTDATNFGTPFVKGEAGSSIIITQEKYGNGVYIAECRDSNGNLSSEKIELLAWDTNGPASITYQVTPDNTTPSSHKSIRILATDASDGDGGLAEKPYAIYGPAEESFYNESISGKTNAEIVSFIEEKRTSDPTKMSDWTDSVLTVDKEGYYVLFAKDVAGNISHSQAQIKKIDVVSPVIDPLDVSSSEDGLTNTSYNNEVFNIETVPRLFTLSATTTDNCSASDDLIYSWYKDGVKIAEGTGVSKIYLSPLSKTELGNEIGVTTVATFSDAQTFYGVGDGTTGGPFNANGQYKVVAEDECGNTATSEILILNMLDITNPTMDSPVIDTADSVKTNTIRINNASDNIRLANKPLTYRKQGETGTPTTNVIYDVTENGTYFVDLFDAAGNKITRSVVINNIDSVSPVITGYEFVHDHTSDTVQIVVTATDENLAGEDITDDLQYCLAASSTALETSTAWQGSNIIDNFGGLPLSSGTYWLGVKDKAGNLVSQFVSINSEYISGNLDTMTPDQVLTYIEQSPTTWTNGDVQLTVSLPSGITSPLYSFNSEEATDYSASNKKSFGGNGFVIVRVKDEYGNVYPSDPFTISNIDKAKPTISTAVNENGNKVTITVGDALSGLQKVTVTAPSASEETIYDYSALTKASDVVEYIVPQNGTYTFKVYDKAGNIETASETITGAITNNTDLTPSNINARIMQIPAADVWTNGDVTLKVALNTTDGLVDAPYKWTGQTDFGTSNEFVVSENGTYTVTIKDTFGNEIESTDYVVDHIDKVDPAIYVTVNDRGNAVNITATDSTSKVQKITIQGGTYTNETTIKDAGGSLAISTLITSWSIPVSNTTYTVKAYDNAGNTKAYNLVVEDATTDNEELSAEGLKAHIVQSPTGWANTDVVLTLALSNTGDLAENPYSWDDGATWSRTRTHTVSANGDYKVKVKDRYGNVIESDTYTVSNIDKTAPVGDVRYKDETKNTAIFSLEDNPPEGETAVSGIDKLTLCTTTNGLMTETVIYDELDSEVALREVEWPVPQTGDYSFKIYDNAGNTRVMDVTFDGAITSNTELTADTLAVRIVKVPSTLTTEDVRLQLVLTNTADLADAPFKWGKVDTFRESTTTTDPSTGNEIVVNNDEISYLSDDFTTQNFAEARGNGWYFVIVKDKYGNEIKSNYIKVDNIDRSAPYIPMGSEPAVDETGTISFDVTDVPYLGSIPVGYADTDDAASGISKATISGGTYTTETVVQEFADHPNRATVSFRVPTVGTYSFKLYDAIGNASLPIEIEVAHAVTDNVEINDPDTLKSKIASDSANVEWTAGPVRLSVNLASFDGLAPNPFKWSNQSDYSNVNYVDVTENGDYTVSIKDVYGNENVSSAFTVSNIDNVEPTITLSKSADGTKLNYSVSDSQSGIMSVTWEGGALETLTPIRAFSNPQSEVNGSVPFPNNGDYVVTVTDYCGNSASANISVENISAPNPLLDTTSEGISEGVTASVRTSPTGWTNGNVIVSVDMPNKTGVDPNGYLWSSDAPVSEETKTYIGLKGNRTSIVVTDNGAVKVTVTDEYGTEFNSDAIVIDNIDKTSPDIDASLSEDGTKIVVNATDELSGISRLLYTIDGAGETTVLTLSAFASDISREVPVSNNGTYLFTVYDNAGNSDSFEIVVTTAATGILNDAYISSNIKFGTSDKTNQDVTITVDIPDKSLLASEPYSWDNGETWTNDASYVCTDNGTYNVLVKDKYDNIYTGTAVVSNIDRVDPVLNLFQNGNKLQITAGDNSQISKVTMNRPNDRYEETIKEYSASSMYDVFSVDLTENGVYTVSVYDSAGNKLSREINIEGVVVTEPVGNENSGDTTAPATDIILINKDTTETQNPTATTGNTSSSGNVVKEYHYDTKEKTSIVTVDRPVSSGSSSASSYAPRYTTPVPTYNYPATTASSMPAVKITPTPTPVPTTVKNTTSTTSSTAKPVSTTSNVSTTAKKVSPWKTTSVVTTTKTTETTLDKANAGVEEESADAKTMYRNNRVEQTSEEDTSKKKDPKVGLIIFGSVLGIALLGVGIYAFTKRKEQKKIAE